MQPAGFALAFFAGVALVGVDVFAFLAWVDGTMTQKASIKYLGANLALASVAWIGYEGFMVQSPKSFVFLAIGLGMLAASALM